VRAMVKLQGYPSEYLYAYRILSPVVIEQLTKTQDAKAEYDRLLKQRFGVQLTFALVYALVSLIFLLASIWAGMWFSDRLVAPIVQLLEAARNVAQGDFNAKVNVIDGPGDLITLSQTFNMMTDQVRLHQNQLVETNEQLDDRRRFTEAMLAGVSAGVIGIDEHDRISLVNRSALSLLNHTENELMGHQLSAVLPAMADIYETALSKPNGSAEGQVEMNVAGQDLSFVVRITTERSDIVEHGYVLTFDDITQLVSAQRNSAWSDIARRIAHEIKNPLTPIQLSAERLKRKYLKEITTDKHVFEQCTDTIIRQVGDLGRIVDEFSSFARMPKAVPELNDLAATIQEATVLQRVSSSEIDIVTKAQVSDLKFPFDRRLITQAITNLVKNAREAIEARDAPTKKGRIVVETGVDHLAPYIRVTDNGIGLPQENRNRLAEPYMTTREKGTGLGLAIVKRIMEEHGGRLKLEDAPSGSGASITLYFAPLHELAELET
jgi:two-component system, NtrC family, nitrogen regulation sensor histidine kinase NtrY